jgi:hypothetical protein
MKTLGTIPPLPHTCSCCGDWLINTGPSTPETGVCMSRHATCDVPLITYNREDEKKWKGGADSVLAEWWCQMWPSSENVTMEKLYSVSLDSSEQPGCRSGGLWSSGKWKLNVWILGHTPDVFELQGSSSSISFVKSQASRPRIGNYIYSKDEWSCFFIGTFDHIDYIRYRTSRKAHGSNLGYPDPDWWLWFSVNPGKCRDSASS